MSDGQGLPELPSEILLQQFGQTVQRIAVLTGRAAQADDGEADEKDRLVELAGAQLAELRRRGLALGEPPRVLEQRCSGSGRQVLVVAGTAECPDCAFQEFPGSDESHIALRNHEAECDIPF
jgi:hypothetical protein